MPALSGSSSTFGLRPTVFTQLIVDKLVVAGQPLLLVSSVTFSIKTSK